MKLLLSTPTGRPVGKVLLRKILDLGFEGIRQDIPDDHEQTTALLRELRDMPAVYPVLLLAGGHMRRGHMAPAGEGDAWTHAELVQHTEDTCIKLQALGFFDRTPERQPALEIGNEPDIAAKAWKTNPRGLARAFRDCYRKVREFSPTCPVLTPSVSNLNPRGFRYLEKMAAEGLPADCGVAVHRYPNHGDPYAPHDTFPSRYEEASRLVEITQGRDIWLTETGLAEGPHDGHYHTEMNVADAFEHDVRFWSGVSAVKAFVSYQVNDGPNRREQLDTYGFRRLDGSWKPVAERVRKAARIAQETA